MELKVRLCVLLLALSVCVTLQVRAQEEDEDEDVHVEDDLGNLGDEELLDGDGDGEVDLEDEEKPTPTPAAPTVRPAAPPPAPQALMEIYFCSFKSLNSTHQRFPPELLETLFGFNSSPRAPERCNQQLPSSGVWSRSCVLFKITQLLFFCLFFFSI